MEALKSVLAVPRLVPGSAQRAEVGSYFVDVLPDGIVRLGTVGALDEAGARAYMADAQAALHKVPEPVRILGDARRAGNHSAAAKRILRSQISETPPGYMAVVGAPLPKRLFVWLLARNTLLKDVRFFDDEASALAWLRAAGR